jgi:hypothetical protein
MCPLRPYSTFQVRSGLTMLFYLNQNVLTETGVDDWGIRVRFPAEAEGFHCSTASESALGPHMLLFHGNWGSFLGVKGRGVKLITYLLLTPRITHYELQQGFS